MPGIGLGRNKDFAWGLTAQIGDNSDVWEEELNEAKTHYKVDGEWRELKITEEIIKVKGQEDYKMIIRETHRGPIIGIPELQFNSALLFGGSISTLKDAHYSFGWGGAARGDHSI